MAPRTVEELGASRTVDELGTSEAINGPHGTNLLNTTTQTDKTDLETTPMAGNESMDVVTFSPALTRDPGNHSGGQEAPARDSSVRKDSKFPDVFRLLFPLRLVIRSTADESIIVRKAAISSLSKMLREGSCAAVRAGWRKAVLPCVVDVEPSVTEHALEEVDATVWMETCFRVWEETSVW